MEWTVAIGVDTHKDVHVAVAVDRFGAWGTKTLSCVSGSQFVLVDETSEQISSVHPHG